MNLMLRYLASVAKKITGVAGNTYAAPATTLQSATTGSCTTPVNNCINNINDPSTAGSFSFIPVAATIYDAATSSLQNGKKIQPIDSYQPLTALPFKNSFMKKNVHPPKNVINIITTCFASFIKELPGQVFLQHKKRELQMLPLSNIHKNTLPINKHAMRSFLPTANLTKFSFVKKIIRKSGVFAIAFFIAGLFLAVNVSGQAVSIFTNPITGTNPGQTNPYTTGQTINANITVSGIGHGTGLAGANGNNAYTLSGWSTGALSTTDYDNWVLTPNPGYHINFSSFVYAGAINFSTASWDFRSNAAGDNFATNIGTPATAGATITLTGAPYQNITSATEFRLFGFNFT